MSKYTISSLPDIHIYQYFAATLLPAAILLAVGFSYIKTLNNDISLSKSELAILPALMPLYYDIINLQEIRGLQYLASTTNDPSLNKKIIVLQQKTSHIHEQLYSAHPDIEKKYRKIISKPELKFTHTQLSSSNPNNVFDTYSSFIFDHFLFLQKIARDSNLLLDADLDISTLVEVSVIRIPSIIEIIGQLRGRSSAWMYNEKIEEHRTQIEYMFESARKELKLLQAVITSLSKQKEIESILNTITINDTLANYLSQFHSTLQLPPSKQKSNLLFTKGSEVLESIHQLNEQVISIIELRLNKRIRKQYNKQFAAMLSIFLAILSMAYFISRFYRTNRESFVNEIKTREKLTLSEARQRTITETMIDSLIIINKNGLIQNFNPASEKLFGHKAHEIIGENVRILMPEPYQSKHDQYLKKYIETGKKNIIGTSVELTGLHKNGSVFPIELSVTEMNAGKERLFSGIIRDISERKHIAILKDEFISRVSHELRTPLTSIKGSLNLISAGVVGELPEQSLAMFKIACNNTDHLLLLINDILDIQQITSGQMRFKFEILEVMPFLHDVIHDNTVYGADNDVRFIISQSLPEAKVRVDRHRLQQIMNNLLSNAAKFSGESETVEIGVNQAEDKIIISVVDRGYGIADEFKPHVFESFTQSESPVTQKVKGSGLGLSIAKALIEKQGGNIDFISKEGLGSIFYIELPEFKESPHITN